MRSDCSGIGDSNKNHHLPLVEKKKKKFFEHAHVLLTLQLYLLSFFPGFLKSNFTLFLIL